MKWRGNSKEKAVHGVMDVAIPQFTIIDYRTVTTKEVLDTGKMSRCWCLYMWKY